MSPRPFHRWMSRLALGAALALSLLPAAGRLLGAEGERAAGSASAGGSELHRDHHATDGGGRGQPPANSGGGDCGYCPLLASLVPSPQRPPLFALRTRAAAPGAVRADPRLTRRHPAGLGSRGPPNS
ncbi:DUF2946 family protein [Luteimonas sp. RD2P54]|uniref:DUF2946 family protein n=1 Tax=Luteimonas endophytica TaxID=3042023 RepID=A0ABT6J5Z7_9GAMM|nr:DUF2946 family protein [Luteimonas endophytica]MDH5822250.1 DUF2946 family protein [Luteimonas endophytica]